MSKAQDVTSRLTDTKNYTGASKERFNQDGSGKGKVGREDVFDNTGSTSSHSRVASTLSTAPKKQVVGAKGSDFGEKPNKITVFSYGDKYDTKGCDMVLVKTKFPTWVKMNEALIKLTPQGKAKIIVDQQLKEIKTLEGFTDKGKYLCITASDFKKYDKTQSPAPFTQ